MDVAKKAKYSYGICMKQKQQNVAIHVHVQNNLYTHSVMSLESVPLLFRVAE